MKSWRFSGGLDPGNTRKNKIKDDPPFLTWGRVNNELIWGRVWTLDRWAAAAKLLQLCPTLCDPTDSSPLGSPVPGILQARTLEWVAISFSSAWKWKVKEVAQSCPTLSDPMDRSPPGSSVHGIFQARVLEWGAIAFSPECKSYLNFLKSGNGSYSHYFCILGHYVEFCMQ